MQKHHFTQIVGSGAQYTANSIAVAPRNSEVIDIQFVRIGHVSIFNLGDSISTLLASKMSPKPWQQQCLRLHQEAPRQLLQPQHQHLSVFEQQTASRTTVLVVWGGCPMEQTEELYQHVAYSVNLMQDIRENNKKQDEELQQQYKQQVQDPITGELPVDWYETFREEAAFELTPSKSSHTTSWRNPNS